MLFLKQYWSKLAFYLFLFSSSAISCLCCLLASKLKPRSAGGRGWWMRNREKLDKIFITCYHIWHSLDPAPYFLNAVVQYLQPRLQNYENSCAEMDYGGTSRCGFTAGLVWSHGWVAAERVTWLIVLTIRLKNFICLFFLKTFRKKYTILICS